jgi:hypothetical protein
MPCVVATFGKSIASVSRLVTNRTLKQLVRANNGLDEPASTKEPVDEPGARSREPGRSARENIPNKEMTAQLEAIADFGPSRRSALADELRESEELTGIRLCLGRANGSTGTWADGHEVVV